MVCAGWLLHSGTHELPLFLGSISAFLDDFRRFLKTNVGHDSIFPKIITIKRTFPAIFGSQNDREIHVCGVTIKKNRI
jgi:hypothetical protein